MKGLEKYSSDI